MVDSHKTVVNGAGCGKAPGYVVIGFLFCAHLRFFLLHRRLIVLSPPVTKSSLATNHHRRRGEKVAVQLQHCAARRHPWRHRQAEEFSAYTTASHLHSLNSCEGVYLQCTQEGKLIAEVIALRAARTSPYVKCCWCAWLTDTSSSDLKRWWCTYSTAVLCYTATIKIPNGVKLLPSDCARKQYSVDHAETLDRELSKSFGCSVWPQHIFEHSVYSNNKKTREQQ